MRIVRLQCQLGRKEDKSFILSFYEDQGTRFQGRYLKGFLRLNQGPSYAILILAGVGVWGVLALRERYTHFQTDE